jgi:hypothetical protein
MDSAKHRKVSKAKLFKLVEPELSQTNVLQAKARMPIKDQKLIQLTKDLSDLC